MEIPKTARLTEPLPRRLTRSAYRLLGAVVIN